MSNYLLDREFTKNHHLSVDGGEPAIPKNARKTIYPVITQEDGLHVTNIIGLKDRGVSEVQKLTQEYREYVGANFAIPTASGTSSLHIALAGAGIQPGDEVITTALTFIATAMAILHVKAIPIFADIDPRTFCIDSQAVEKLITSKTKAIMPVHVHGLPADMTALKALAKKYHLKIIEDASHAHSAKINNQVCGSLGDTAGQSLMADKNYFVGGEGGMAFFSTEESFELAKKYLIDNGIQYDMSWVAATLGRSQLKRLPYYDAIRSRNADYLSKKLIETGGFIPPHVPEGYAHAYNMYRIIIDPIGLGLDDIPVGRLKEAIKLLLLEEGVPAREWQNAPIPSHKPFCNRLGWGKSYPWCLSSRTDFGYEQNNFPKLLQVLESTLVLCRELRSPVEFERVERYIYAFEKIKKNKDRLAQLARSLSYTPCFNKDPRLG